MLRGPIGHLRINNDLYVTSFHMIPRLSVINATAQANRQSLFGHKAWGRTAALVVRHP